MKKLITILTLVVSIIIPYAPSVLAASSSINVSPTKTTLSLTAGKSGTLNIYVQNATSETVTVNVDFRDTTIDSTGTRVLAPKGQQSSSDGLSAYMSGPSSFTVGANQLKSYSAAVTIPSSMQQMTRYGGVAFTSSADSNSVASLVVANITAASSAPPSAPQSTQNSNSSSSPSQPTSQTNSQPSTPNALNSAQDSAKTTRNLQGANVSIQKNVRKSNNLVLWIALGLLGLLILLAGIYFWRHKRQKMKVPLQTNAVSNETQIAPSESKPQIDSAEDINPDEQGKI